MRRYLAMPLALVVLALALTAAPASSAGLAWCADPFRDVYLSTWDDDAGDRHVEVGWGQRKGCYTDAILRVYAYEVVDTDPDRDVVDLHATGELVVVGYDKVRAPSPQRILEVVDPVGSRYLVAELRTTTGTRLRSAFLLDESGAGAPQLQEVAD